MDAVSTRVVKTGQLGLAYALKSTIGWVAGVAAAALAGFAYGIRPALPFQPGLFLVPPVAGLTLRYAPQREDGASNCMEGPVSAGMYKR